MSESDATGLVVRTSRPGWLASVANAYKSKASFTLSDDAGLGIDPLNDTLFDMGRKANLSQCEWIAVVIALGVSVAGAFLLVMSILDPEPFSKIAFATGTGAVLIAGGGFGAIRILVGHKPPSVKFSPKGFEISFE